MSKKPLANITPFLNSVLCVDKQILRKFRNDFKSENKLKKLLFQILCSFKFLVQNNPKVLQLKPTPVQFIG